MPGFVITGQNRNFLLGIGGNVYVRTAYGFNGISDNKDFVTSAIPVPNNARERQQYLIDPTTSVLFFKGVVDSEKLGLSQVISKRTSAETTAPISIYAKHT